MTAASFFSLSEKEQKKILKSVIRGANEDQRRLMKEYKALKKSKKKLV